MAYSPRPLNRMPGVAAFVSAVCVALWSTPTAADVAPLPRSLAEAIQMERADALPLTAFYETPSLAGTKPGALLRQTPFSGYTIPVKTIVVWAFIETRADTAAADEAVVRKIMEPMDYRGLAKLIVR